MQLKSVFLPISVPEKRLLTLVLSCIVLFLLPQPVWGQAPTFGTMMITENTTLTGDHHGNIIIDTAGRIILDCDGHSVIGPGVPFELNNGDFVDIGIHLIDTTRVTVLNCFVRGFDTGFRLVEGGRDVLLGNTARNNSRNGFALVVSDRNGLNDNTARGNGRNGFTLIASRFNNLNDNTATGNGLGRPGERFDGFQIFRSDDNNLFDNTANRNGRHGVLIFQSDDNTLMDNTANRNHASGFALFDRRADGVFGIVSSDGNDLMGNTANSNDNYGFRVNGATNGTDEGNDFTVNEGCNNGISDAEDDNFAANTWMNNDFCDPGNTDQ